MSTDILNKRIKTLETDTKILRRLYFIKYRYDGKMVSESAKLIGITKRVGYIWQDRWNEKGYEGLIPKYAGGRPSKLTDAQKGQLIQLLKQNDTWTTEEVRELIFKEFNVEYTNKQIRIILKKFGMKCAKPFPHDYRRPANAEELLKKSLAIIDKDMIIGFMDESSPQTTANTQRLWSFGKPIIYKNTDKMKANAFGCYMLNGTSVIDFKEHSTKEDVSEFLKTIREKNPLNKIAILCDNFTSHRAHDTIQCAKEQDIILIFLPKYSPDLNPIEFIWKSIKRVISRNFVHDIDHMRSLIQDSFLANASKLSFAGYWIERFLGGVDWFKKLGS